MQANQDTAQIARGALVAENRKTSAGHSWRWMQVGFPYSPRPVQLEIHHFVLFATKTTALILPKNREVIMESILSTGQVGRLLGIQPYRIAYAINTGQIAEVSFRFLGKRCFTMSDIERIAQHFGVEEIEFVTSSFEQSVG